jgi:SAM-dependent methyltransferase
MAILAPKATRKPATVEPDPGVETLDRMASVDRYNAWMYRRIEPFLGSQVVEVGCGLGNMTSFLLSTRQLVSVDILPASVRRVQDSMQDEPEFQAVVGDICSDEIVQQLGDYGFDTAVCLNVLEHIEDDGRALHNMYTLIKQGGRLVLLVPAGSYLFGTLDRAIGHHRRYDVAGLAELVTVAGFRVDEMQGFNIFGIPGWFLASRILKRRVPPRGLLGLFNFLAPLFILIEETIRPRFGQSIICIATKE